MFSEFYCQSGGSNLNAGSTTGNSAVYTGVGDSDGTSVFTPSDGSTPASTVSAGDFGSVYVTIGATVAVFIGRITTVAAGVNGAITFSTTLKSGTFPASSAGAHTITCKTGGAWQGPNAAVGFPWTFVTNSLTNLAGDAPRINMLAGTYSITANIADSNAGPITKQGYTATPGDGGRFTLDGGTSGASYVLLTLTGGLQEFADAIFQNNGATGNANGVTNTTGVNYFRRCTFTAVRGNGFSNAASADLEQCEAYACNQSNTSTDAGFFCNGALTNLFRCIAHDNTGSNNNGFTIGTSATTRTMMRDCIADSNTLCGLLHGGNAGNLTALRCEFYNNGADGIRIAGVTAAGRTLIEDCNFVANTTTGINKTDSLVHLINVINCGFQGNGTTTTGLGNNNVEGSVNYGSLPWSDPANGNFSPTDATMQNAGTGAFTMNAGSYTKTTANYPDRAAARHQDPSAGGNHILGA